MLILSRKIGEEIFINQGEIRIKLIFLDVEEALLGIHAPREIEIDRKAFFLRKQQDKSL